MNLKKDEDGKISLQTIRIVQRKEDGGTDQERSNADGIKKQILDMYQKSSQELPMNWKQGEIKESKDDTGFGTSKCVNDIN